MTSLPVPAVVGIAIIGLLAVPANPATAVDAIKPIDALVILFFAFVGFERPTALAGEIRNVQHQLPMALVVGSAELPLLRKQTADFAGYRASHGLPVIYEEIPGANHFTIMDEMAKPSGRITTLIRQVIERV